ncbi:MAG: single-stranded DNA-binding protein [Deltaproteobacteria bacterium]|nr:single-stranded DNA-binding protein [Deltaproteobacteria bacterium]MBW2078360.1 single-stranded DNA-binding protein [Deltaproteobacteria bacterium]MBW2311588.1 single-stranded DNA-binding protein [Deltaproteobacteria bacterium]RLB30687.1 MAG: single-stranded DNA-binding protein [Deltaproteobacteria bacterium]
MASLNKVMLIGYLGADPELRYTPSGSPVANFRIATTEQWTDREGEKQEKTEWHRIVAWRKLAETCGEYLHKGSLVYVEGRLETRNWEDRDGNKRWTTEILAWRVQMLDRKGEPTGPPPTEEPFLGEEPPDAPDDDIPF